MTSVRETFENDMMNILKFTVNDHMANISTRELLEVPEIEDDTFWNVWFPLNCIRLISPPSLQKNSELYLMSKFHDAGELLISTPDQIYHSMNEDDYWYNYYITLEDNICKYLFLVYNDMYKDKIREWAQDEFMVSLK